MSELKKGDVVMIYEQHLSKEKPEGKAQILSKEGRTEGYYRVRFLNDGFITTRFAHSEDKYEIKM